MKATDLRVGNTVYYSRYATKTFKIVNITVDDLADFENYPELCNKRYKPVPLSDPILDKAKSLNKNAILFDSKMSLAIENDVTRMTLIVATQTIGTTGNFVAELHGEDGFIVLKEVLYLHELQNLVFALTGKEVRFHGI